MSARRVLVIEDEKGAREALESLLREEGFLVRSAADGEAGLSCFDDFDPHIIVCDYYLPDLNGLQLLRRVRRRSNGRVRFIALTAGVGGSENERALRREADAFLGKPIDLARLHAALSRGEEPPFGRHSPGEGNH